MTRSIVNACFAFSTGFLILFPALNSVNESPNEYKAGSYSRYFNSLEISGGVSFYYKFSGCLWFQTASSTTNTPKTQDKPHKSRTPDTAKLIASRRQ
jgi:hypothetical protein